MPSEEVTSGRAAAYFALEIERQAPADVWAGLGPFARQQWLRQANEGAGHFTSEWYQLPPEVQRALRYAIRRIMAFMGQAGLDLMLR